MQFDFVCDVEDDDGMATLPDLEPVEDLMRDFADWIYHQLREAYDYQMSDEACKEAIEANEYTFDEDGERL